MKKCIICFLFFITGTLFFSCTPEAERASNIVCLVDFSKSIPPPTLSWYESIIQNNVIKSFGEKDKIIILPIDYGSQTSSAEIFFADFEKESFRKELDSPLQQEKVAARRINKYKDSLEVLFKSAFANTREGRNKFSQGTDVIGGIKQANKYFLPGQNNLIVIFSDMINETEELNLFTGLSSSKDINVLLKRIKIPEVNKAEVIVMTGEQPKIKIEKYKMLKEFWKSFFSNANLDLIEYGSGGENVLVNKINSYKTK
jgi:hypothetical protein